MSVDPNILTTLSPLDSLKPEHIRELTQKSYLATAVEGQFIFQQGDVDSRMIFIVRGTVELRSNDGSTRSLITGGTSRAKHAIAHMFPRPLSAQARTEVKYLIIDNELIDLMLTWDQTSTLDAPSVHPKADSQIPKEQPVGDDDWMIRILQTKAFHKIPPANIQALFNRMELIRADSNKMIIRQGDEGDYYYIIRKGHCQVSRKTPARPNGIVLAELTVGDSFGEDALISNTKRNATVASMTPVELMRLSKEDFHKLLQEPLLNWISQEEATAKAAEGAQWLDVRLPSEYKQWHIPNSENIPLSILRMKINQLADDKVYLVYCDTGRRSSAAAYLLAEQGLEAFVIKGGIQDTETTVTDFS